MSMIFSLHIMQNLYNQLINKIFYCRHTHLFKPAYIYWDQSVYPVIFTILDNYLLKKINTNGYFDVANHGCNKNFKKSNKE